MNVSALPRLSGGAGLFLLAVATALIALFAGRESAYATFEPAATVTIDETSAGEPADIKQTFNVQKPDVNFSGLVFFTPPEWGVAADADIPDGAIVGQLSSTATLGLIGGGCNSALGVNFTMLDATLNDAQTVPFTDPEITAGNPAGDTEGDNDDQFDIVNGLPLGATRLPDYIPRIFPGAEDAMISRQYGQTLVSGIPVSLNFVLFEPGTVLGRVQLPTDLRLGYPSVTVLQSIGDPEGKPAPGTINDFCSTLVSNPTTFGIAKDNPATSANEGGAIVRTNPDTPGTYQFTTFASGLRDADGDGIENFMDVCSNIANPEWDPRAVVVTGQPGDADGDRQPDACDDDDVETCPISGGLHDCDLDLYGNRQDNCPSVANSKGVLGGTGDDNQVDTDLDQIGDACDPNPTSPDGELPRVCRITAINIGSSSTPGFNPADVQPCNPNAVIQQAETPTPVGQTPTPVGQTKAPTPVGGTGVGDPGDPGIGSLSPVGGSLPVWAAILAGLGAIGALGGFTLAGWSMRRRD